MKNPTLKQRLAVRTTATLAALTAFAMTSQAQVTLEQVTDGLVTFYPLDYLNPDGVTTPDVITRRDMTLFGMGASNIVASTRPGGAATNCFNFTQTGLGTVIYYVSSGQNALDMSGDFLPFCNQINASMSFWVRLNGLTAGGDRRFFGEADNTGSQANPLFLIGTSSSGTPDTSAHWLFRQQDATGPGGSTVLSDGTFQFPVLGTRGQGNHNTSAANPLLDGNWHLFTMTIDSNASYAVYVDGVLDIGPAVDGTQHVDFYGNPATLPSLYVTNLYYTTNDYPVAGVSNPPPNGFVKWVFNGMYKTGSTAFGGFKRGGVSAGAVCQIDDIGFWDRVLSQDEVNFVFTNGIPGLALNTNKITINSFTVDLNEVGSGDQVAIRWNVSGASTEAGGLTISGVGDVTAIGSVGSTNVTLTGDQTYTFTLTAHNGIVVDQTASVTVRSFRGVDVDSGWNLVQRFDGLFPDTTLGINGNGWVSAISDFTGVNRDRWNVVTLTNGGLNKVLAPRTGYAPDVNSATGFESRGALAYGLLNGLTIQPNENATLFFRFSLREVPPNAGLISDLDFGVGLSDFTFIGPLSGAAGPGNAGNVGPYFSIVRNGGGAFAGGPFDLVAGDYGGTGITNNYSYIASVNPNGLETNVTYYVWMDVENRNTRAQDNGDGTTNTVDMPTYSVWLQKQGDPARTQLFSGFHGNRDFVNFNPVVDSPTPELNKVFVSIGDESIVAAAAGSYIATNMIVVDDFYLTKGEFNTGFPKSLDLRSVSRNGNNVTIAWNSFGSLLQTNTYTVQRKTNLLDPAWQTLVTGHPSGGDVTSYTDATATGDTGYYRIIWP